jgi:chemotaxis protein MotA
MDIATILGIISGIGLIVFAIAIGGTMVIFWNLPSLLIVFGGTIATTLIKFPLSVVMGMFGVVRNVFFVKTREAATLISEIVGLSQTARKGGLLALEEVEVSDHFLKRGIQLVVDGVDSQLIRSILNTEIAYRRDRHKVGQKIFKGMGAAAPAFGMIGTLIGLVQMLTKMDDPKNIGPAMAVALLTTLYGALLANLLFLPIADKLELRTEKEALTMEVVVEGVLSLAAGDNSAIVEHKLTAFVSPRKREQANSSD